MLLHAAKPQQVGMPALLCKCKARGIEAFTLRQFALLSNRILLAASAHMPSQAMIGQTDLHPGFGSLVLLNLASVPSRVRRTCASANPLRPLSRASCRECHLH